MCPVGWLEFLGFRVSPRLGSGAAGVRGSSLFSCLMILDSIIQLEVSSSLGVLWSHSLATARTSFSLPGP